MVYVDKLRDWGWEHGPSCHLVADTLDELHAFALRIGLKREWFQDKPRAPHYDLSASKRALAVRTGALELGDRAFRDRVRAMIAVSGRKAGAAK